MIKYTISNESILTDIKNPQDCQYITNLPEGLRFGWDVIWNSRDALKLIKGIVIPDSYLKSEESHTKSQTKIYNILLSNIPKLQFIGIVGNKEWFKGNKFIQSLRESKYSVLFINKIEDFQEECNKKELEILKKKKTTSIKNISSVSPIIARLKQFGIESQSFDTNAQCAKFFYAKKGLEHWVFELDFRLVSKDKDFLTKLNNADLSDRIKVEEFLEPYMSTSIHNIKLNMCVNHKDTDNSSLYILNGIKKVPVGFVSYLSYKRIYIPGSIESLADRTIVHCQYCDSVTIGEGVKNVSVLAIYCCYTLKEILIPKSVESLGLYKLIR